MNSIRYTREERKHYAMQFSKKERWSYRKGKKYGIYIGLNIHKQRKKKQLLNSHRKNIVDGFARSMKENDLKNGSIHSRSYYLKESEKVYSGKSNK